LPEREKIRIMDEGVRRENEWPVSLDAMTAAPDHHEVLLENDRVRVLDSLVKVGDATPVHTHRWPAVLQIIGVSDFVRFDAEGNEIFDSRGFRSRVRDRSDNMVGALAPHFVKNIGNSDLRVISIELKD
jgi:hypothetical protein